MVTRFSSVASPVRRGDGVYGLTIEKGWEQGRGAFGGMVLGALYAAAEDALAASGGGPGGDVGGKRLRSMTGEIFAPVPAAVPTEIHVETLRRGHHVTTLAARFVVDGNALAQAVFLFGDARTSEFDQRSLLAPSALSAGTDGLRALRIEPPLGPDFGQHFEYRFVEGAPFSEEKCAATACWIRHRKHGDGQLSTRDAIALSDVIWPVLYVHTPVPRPMATITFMLALCEDPRELAADTFVLHRGTALATTQGYEVEQRELWLPDGRLFAISHQTIAVIK